MFRDPKKLLFVIIFGVALLVFGIFMLVTTPTDYGETTATVISVTETYDSDDGTRYETTYEYTVDGKTYTTAYTEVAKRSTGETITLYYDPAKPNSTSNTKNTGIIAIFIIAAGGAVLALGLIPIGLMIIKRR